MNLEEIRPRDEPPTPDPAPQLSRQTELGPVLALAGAIYLLAIFLLYVSVSSRR